MAIKISEDLVPLTDLKLNPARVVRQVAETRRPIVLTKRGKGVAVLQSIEDYERSEEQRGFMLAVVEGLADLEAGRESDLAEVRKKLGI